MNSWVLLTLAFTAVILHAWIRSKGSPDWYLNCIVPLVYGGAVAWMFVGEDLIRSLQIILFGAAVPITFLLSAWLRQREREREDQYQEPRTNP